MTNVDQKINSKKLYIPWDSESLRREYDRSSSGHFFDKDTMRFFASRLTSAYCRLNESLAYFITSEKKCFNDPTRVYTLRKAEAYFNDDGFQKIRIETVNTFLTMYLAKKAMGEMK